ncbi:hypothetical protein BN7_2044 [Wickerhamomyces ciferrii]|uniref:Protein transport protein SEC23 n=1 Tax=Wickerhamomyces ciferrii (strain ATCC 14091 / BCRC 22168 / CBS 111 / JCM 3599 / NBRC 0793 / NRRL Y-1031 F-60-10) TaxID=1206466 RepID=K0KM92_WICCF|nr:uncharacterized protein BN7_2044 [Wickerhamomyces ciferrii]CCH42499.1 hypothetical protein BN7_2044 [Wickerhamomyces ciferrii]
MDNNKHEIENDFYAAEEVDGVRFTWNSIPTTKITSNRLSVPIASLYTPLKDREDLPIIPSEPTVCRQPCGAILNPFAVVDYNTKTWNCPICSAKNTLPAHFFTQFPPQCDPSASTVEYILTRPPAIPPIFLFVVDTCLGEEDFDALKESLMISLSLIPPESLIGFISFGKNINLYEFTNGDVLKSYAFNGAKEYTTETISSILGFISSDLRNPTQGVNQSAFRFLQNTSYAEYQLTLILENLKKDSWLYKSNERPLRATGSALNIATRILESAYPKSSGARIMLFTGGPATYGPGIIVDNQLKQPIRSHHDIESNTNNAIHYKKAKKFYSTLAENCSENGYTVDIFIGAYDQVGLYEMEALSDKTGGLVVLSDSFTTSIFKQSFQRVFNKDNEGFLNLGFNGTLEVKTSKQLKISGLIGHATSLNRKTSNVSDKIIGVGETNSWKLSSITPNSSYGIYFEVENSEPQTAFVTNIGPSALVQYSTHYTHSTGTTRLRVTTVAKPIDINGDLSTYFDQEVSAVLIAREAVSKLEKLDVSDVLLWIDKKLVSLLKAIGEYRVNQPETVRLSNNISLFPQFIYHLRRSQFLQVFNNSPDETSFYKHVFLDGDTTNSLIMIQPTLTSFSQDSEEGEPVLLDSLSLNPEKILLLDTFFHILIYHGSTVAAWRRAGYQDMEEYASFKEFLEEPRHEAADLLIDRFPLPRFIDTEEGGSQARFLYSKLNPSTTHQTIGGNIGSGMGVILTDDVSLQSFMEHVQKLVVQSK